MSGEVHLHLRMSVPEASALLVIVQMVADYPDVADDDVAELIADIFPTESERETAVKVTRKVRDMLLPDLNREVRA